MRAARFYGPGRPLVIEDVPRPRPGPGEVVVKVKAAGVCHTELHFLEGVLNLGVVPVTLGHEIAGVVEEVGPGVEEPKPGDRVLVYYYVGCGKCRFCLRGEENLCESPRAEYGFITDGGYAEYIKVPARNAVRLPDNITFEQAAPIGCSVTTAIHATRRARPEVGEYVAVYGVGAVGFALIQYNKLIGAKVIAIGRSERKLQLAEELGADYVINARSEDVVERALEITDGRGVDVVYELVGIRETMDNSLRMLAKRGRLVLIGYWRDKLEANPLDLVVKEATITASVGNTLEELVEAVRLVSEGKVKVVVDRVAGLGEINNELERLRRGEVVGRVVINPEI
ncbi:MAG: alcohol dehydrogenase catalytic domain-containing protein [Thermoproteus sp.]|jgi:Zn-dependent alcohol dehydrogenases|uniref:zinc-binding dehydrogenase n=1 Tax=Thermoproteus sp. CP80 TaxID=1650659 RepID=UPI000746765B|nr:zinc-binding dehydrogenase [Thermoproteus sp. CP80]KUO85639.1 MAG: zinc-binding dehydrogenase [Thermoproteus sp. CIS_19]PLC64902.1 zinc-binding dehydrogenase [Thermoproteus sp. CP80]